MSEKQKYVSAGATISACGAYRYSLWREWRGTPNAQGRPAPECVERAWKMTKSPGEAHIMWGRIALHTGGVTGSIPVAPTIKPLKYKQYARIAYCHLRTSAQNSARTCAFESWKIRGLRSLHVPPRSRAPIGRRG